MKIQLLKFMSLTLSLLNLTAFARSFDVQPGEHVAIDVPKQSGATVMFPAPVRLVTGAANFHVVPVGGTVDANSGQRANTSTFHLSSSGTETETVTFVLGSESKPKGTISLQLTPKVTAESFYELKFPTSKSYRSSAGFLSEETNVMVAMIRDDEAFGRQTIDLPIEFPAYREVSLKAVRVYRNGGMTGYVFLVANETRKPLHLNLTALSFGKPNRAVMMHLDHDTLEPCHVNKSSNPKENGCVTALRVLTEGSLKPKYLASSESSFPFVKRVPNEE